MICKNKLTIQLNFTILS